MVAPPALDGFHTAVAGALSILGLTRLIGLRRRVTGTTLVAPWLWALAGVGLLAVTDVAYRLGPWDPSRSGPMRYLAASLTLCPILALLGAKRPQDRGWQWVVVTLVAVLAVPVGQQIVFGQGPLSIPLAWSAMLGVLMAVELINFLATANAWRAVLVVTAQGVWLAPFLAPLLAGPVHSEVDALLRTAGWAVLLLALAWPRRRPRTAEPLDRVWLDFRDQFGLVWAHRVADRMEQTAELADWPVRLRWPGFTPLGPAALEADLRRQLAAGLWAALRRFVSIEWMAERGVEELQGGGGRGGGRTRRDEQ